MFDILQYEFMQNALIASILVSISSGIIGTFIVVNRIVFISGGIAHAAYGGIGISYFLNSNPILGAVIFSIFSALGMGYVQKKTQQRADTIIGVMWSLGMAIGIIFLDLTKGYKPDLMSYLFGSILAVPKSDLWFMLGVDVLIILFVYFFYKELLAISFDETFTEVRNVPIMTIYLLLMSAIALTIVMMMRVVGLIMVIALLTMPSAISLQYWRNIRSTIFASIFISIFFSFSGLALSYHFNLTSGATIILVSGVSYLMSLIIQQLIQKNKSLTTNVECGKIG